MTDTTRKITASATIGGHTMDNLEIINPGDCFGRGPWLIGIACGNGGGPQFVVEADCCGDAIDIFAEDEKYGHLIAIDVETDGGDYGARVSPGDEIGGLEITERGWVDLRGKFYTDSEAKDACLAEYHVSGQGVAYDTDNLSIDGPEVAHITYHVDYRGDTIDVKPEDLSGLLESLDKRDAILADIKGPGKFEGENVLTFLAYDATMHGEGEVTSNEGWGDNATLLTFDSDRDREFLRDDVYLDEDEAKTLATSSAVIVRESGDGFVSAHWFEKLETAENVFAELRDEYEPEDDDDDVDDDVERNTSAGWDSV